MKIIRKYGLSLFFAMLLAFTLIACKTDEPMVEHGIEEPTEASPEPAPHTHTWGAWSVKTEATFDTEGERERACTSCDARETEKTSCLTVAFRITAVDGDVPTTIRVAEDGNYMLSSPSKVGYDFLGWKTENGEDFAASGTISADVTVHAVYKLLQTTTFAELKERMEGGADVIDLAADIVLTDTIYVSDTVELRASEPRVLTRSADFLGDLFVVGLTKDGKNPNLFGKSPKLSLCPEGTGTITLDGNKTLVTGDVAGSAFFLENSAELNVFDGVSIINCKKTANAYLLSDAHSISSPEMTGGAVAVIANGTFNFRGGVIRDCEVSLLDAAVTDETEQSEGFDASSRGGAVFNYGTFNFYGGVIENCRAGRGGAIYNYRIMYLYGGEIRNNFAAAYGGAIYQPNSQYAYFTVGEAGNAIKVRFSGNEAGKTGGAVFTSHQSSIVIAGGTLFTENKALGGNGGAISTAGALVIEYAEFSKNTASAKGGAIYAYYNAPDFTTREVQIKAGEFTENTAPRGAAVAFGKGDDVETGAIGVIGAVTFRNNNAPANAAGDYGFGGALHLDNKSKVTVSGAAVFENNTAAATGGAVYITKQSEFLIDAASAVSFLSNAATAKNGGAIYATDSAAVNLLTDTVFNGNTAGNSGGAIYLYTGVTASFGKITAENNAATAYGGVIYISGAATAVIDEIFAANNTASQGGFMYETTTATEVTINGGDIRGNTATEAGKGNAVWVNTKKAILKVKGGATGEYLIFTEGDIAGASGFSITAID